MNNTVIQVLQEALSNLEIYETHGCIVIYIGVVKAKIEDRRVGKLKVNIDRHSLTKRIEEVKSRFTGSDFTVTLWLPNNNNELRPGEPLVVIAVSSSNRKLAFEIIEKLVEEYKRCITKSESYVD